MYKSILLTDKELNLLGKIIGFYMANNEPDSGCQHLNAHILLQQILGKQPTLCSNQII